MPGGHHYGATASSTSRQGKSFKVFFFRENTFEPVFQKNIKVSVVQYTSTHTHNLRYSKYNRFPGKNGRKFYRGVIFLCLSLPFLCVGVVDES